ncbi:hypothetical protein AB0D34_26110 [Streptomyces sp. NPDC048420]|uniref:hypothetical protein n=1 Tax=Streptomyces sp. NPDC048420 TaxID=3155755 RepID=UPI00342347BE
MGLPGVSVRRRTRGGSVVEWEWAAAPEGGARLGGARLGGAGLGGARVGGRAQPWCLIALQTRSRSM